MIRDELQARLAAAFSPEADGPLIRGFSEGILLADGLIDAEPFLSTVIGRDLRGHLRRAGIMFRLHAMCRSGDLPYASRFNRMPRGYWHWLELRCQNFVAHLCRTESLYAFPEETATRQADRLANQSDLFEPNPTRLDSVASVDEMAVWLTFGGGTPGQLNHLCWAMPAADQQVWLAHINVLQRAALIGAEFEPSAREAKSLKLRFKEHVEEALQSAPPGHRLFK